MRLHQHKRFLRAYWLLPHRLLNRGCALLMRAKRPRSAVAWAIRRWIDAAQIDMSPFVDQPFDSLEAFFLRTLRPGQRPLGPGLVSPVDGQVFAQGLIGPDTRLLVKGQSLSLHRLVNGDIHTHALADYAGGQYLSIFLSPRGYHHIHAPLSATLQRIQWVPGRYFPQNAEALSHIPAVYERNERAALLFAVPGSAQPLILVLIGASLVGGIQLEDLPVESWRHTKPTRLNRSYQKGERLAHFRFGSTVVLLLPAGLAEPLRSQLGDLLCMGQSLADVVRDAI